MKRILLPLLILSSITTFSQDRIFGRTYTASILPKGSFDIELWHTSRFGRAGQYFHAMDQRMEYEVGLGGNLQTAFYFNLFQKSISDANNEIQQSTEIGFSNEWKLRISKLTSPVGVALYGEIGVKGDEVEFEGKLIADRYFGKNVIAFNAVYEIEAEAARASGKNKFKTAGTPIELNLAYMRNFSGSFGAGIELLSHNDIESGNWNNSIFYAGPTINYRGSKWFIVANYLPQLANLHKTLISPGNKVLDDHERAEARVVIGFSF